MKVPGQAIKGASAEDLVFFQETMGLGSQHCAKPYLFLLHKCQSWKSYLDVQLLNLFRVFYGLFIETKSIVVLVSEGQKL